MKPSPHVLTPLTIAACLCIAGPAQADITVYTDQASFLAAVLDPATDTFNDLPLPGENLGPSIDRTVGPYSYTASAELDLYSAGRFNAWLSTNVATDALVFDNFSPGVQAAGGYFFGSELDGSFLAGQTITLIATDASGSVSQAITDARRRSFLGFVSTGPLLSLTVLAEQGSEDAWPTVNNLILAAVPELETYALMLAGVGALTMLARRRRPN